MTGKLGSSSEILRTEEQPKGKSQLQAHRDSKGRMQVGLRFLVTTPRPLLSRMGGGYQSHQPRGVFHFNQTKCKMQFLRHTSHISSAQQSQTASHDFPRRGRSTAFHHHSELSWTEVLRRRKERPRAGHVWPRTALWPTQQQVSVLGWKTHKARAPAAWSMLPRQEDPAGKTASTHANPRALQK